MKKQWLIPLAMMTAAVMAVSAHAEWQNWKAEANVGRIRFDVNRIHTEWSPDGVWSPDEYTEIPVQTSWISACTNSAADLDAAKNLDFTLGMSWDEDYVYTFVQHVDENGYSSIYDTAPSGMWWNSCMQVCYADANQIGDQRLEYGITRSSETGDLLANIWSDYFGSGYVPTARDYTVVVDGNIVTYEFRTPFSAFSRLQTALENTYGLCYVISWGNDYDFIHTQLASGCSGNPGKNAGNFAKFTLVDTGSTGSEPILTTWVQIQNTVPTHIPYTEIGNSFQLSAHVRPTFATNKDVTWESDAPEIISVDENGLMTIHQFGKATITATTKDTGVSDSKTYETIYYKDEADKGSISFGVKHIGNTWSPDGIWSEDEYSEIPVQPSWISAFALTEEDLQDALNLDFRLGMAWDAEYLYTYVAYENEHGHTNTYTSDSTFLFMQDCFSPSFTGSKQTGNNYFGYDFAHSTANNTLLSNRRFSYLNSDFTPVAGEDFTCVADGNKMVYEIRIPFSAFSSEKPKIGGEYKTCLILGRYISENSYAHTQIASGCSGYRTDAGDFARFILEQNANPDVTITSIPNKQTVRAGDTISYDLTMSGTYDGFSFIVRPPEGMSITSIVAGEAIGGQTINVDKFAADHWMISILPGCAQVKSAETRIATVTLYVNEGITPGERSDIFPSSDEAIVTNQYGDSVYSKNIFSRAYTVIHSIPGDVNGDGVLNYYDVTKLYSCYRRLTEIDNELVKDINGDGAFNYLDVAKLYNMLRNQNT